MLRSEDRAPDYEAGVLSTSQRLTVLNRDKELTITYKELTI